MKKLILLMLLLISFASIASEEIPFSVKYWETTVISDDFTDEKRVYIDSLEINQSNSLKEAARENTQEAALKARSVLNDMKFIRIMVQDGKEYLVIADSSLNNVDTLKIRVDKNEFKEFKANNVSSGAYIIIDSDTISQMERGQELLLGVGANSEIKKYRFSLKGFKEAYNSLKKEQS